jgi:uncharacterized membrane protein YqjE
MKELPVAHSVSSASDGSSAVRPAGTEEPSVGTLVQSAMADVSTLIRAEVELAKTEISGSAKKAGISVGLFAAAGVLAAFAAIYLFITVAEVLDIWLWRWVAYGIVTLFLFLLAGVAVVIGRKMLKKVEKPERTLETLSDLPGVLHREAPGQRHRAVPEVSNGQVRRPGTGHYSV